MSATVSRDGLGAGVSEELEFAIARYAEGDLEDTLKTGVASTGDDLGGEMAEVVKDSTSKWTDEDRHAVAAYLLGMDK